MSQSSIATLQTPNSMKKKVIAALISVVIGHVGVLFAVSHMKVSELKKVEKEPIKVRFVQIREDARHLRKRLMSLNIMRLKNIYKKNFKKIKKF